MTCPPRLSGLLPVLAASLALAAHAPAASAADARPASRTAGTAPGLGRLEAFLGTWHCQGTVIPSPGSPKRPFRSDLKVTYELEEHFIKLDLLQRKSRESPIPFEVVAWWSYEPISRTFVSRAFDNLGGFTLASAPEAEARLAFAGEAQTLGDKVPTRLTFTLRDRELSLLFELSTAVGNWFELLSQTCRR